MIRRGHAPPPERASQSGLATRRPFLPCVALSCPTTGAPAPALRSAPLLESGWVSIHAAAPGFLRDAWPPPARGQRQGSGAQAPPRGACRRWSRPPRVPLSSSPPCTRVLPGGHSGAGRFPASPAPQTAFTLTFRRHTRTGQSRPRPGPRPRCCSCSVASARRGDTWAAFPFVSACDPFPAGLARTLDCWRRCCVSAVRPAACPPLTFPWVPLAAPR